MSNATNEKPEAEPEQEDNNYEEQANEQPAAEMDEQAALQAEVARLKDQLLRAAAELENTRKRMQRDQEETAKYAITGFARDLVAVIENLQRASEAVPKDALTKDPFLKTLSEGVEMTQRELLNIFQRHGIKRIDPIGEKFDHNFHQAVAQIETPDKPPGTVVQVLQAGYVIHDRLLRPAMVGVAKQGEAPQKVDTTA